jgi:hypothetical protein
MKHRIELLTQNRFKIMALPLRVGPVNDADRAFKARFGEQGCERGEGGVEEE